jgi:hypothetical protein
MTAVAFQSLHEWHRHLIDKLGWMLLAKNLYNNDLKIAAYMDSIDHLLKSINAKHEITHDADRKEDLRVYLVDTEFLQEVAIHMLSEKLPNINMKCKGTNSSDATMHGLQKWMKHMFELFGMIAFSNRNGHSSKALSYLDSIERLKASLIKKIKEVEEKDRADDLKILLEKV